MTIDVWMQHPTPRFLAQPLLDPIKHWVGGIPERPIEKTIEAMDCAGVKRAILTAWEGPQGTLISNEEVLGWIKRWPERFAGAATVNLKNPVAAVRTLREAVQEHGFKAMRILPWLWERPCSDPLYYPLFVACVELGIPACFQVGLTGPLSTSETGRPLHVERVALDFPELKIVCGHIGYPWHLEMIAFATKFPNVFIDTSAYKCTRYPTELVAYMKKNGKKKVLFGSGYPMINPQDALEGLDKLGLDEETKQLFVEGNAKRVFGLED